jgi:hypothetical protein
MGFTYLWRKLKIKILLASLKSPFNSKNISNKPLQEACSSSQVVPKTACHSENCSKSQLWHTCIHWRKLTIDSNWSPEQKFWCSSGIELESVFKEASRNFIIIFIITRQPENLKTIFSCTESIDLSVKKYSLGDHSPSV